MPFAAKLLILEDHPLTRQMLVLALRGLGYGNLHSAASGAQALALLQAQEHFDVLICDIQMADMINSMINRVRVIDLYRHAVQPFSLFN